MLFGMIPTFGSIYFLSQQRPTTEHIEIVDGVSHNVKHVDLKLKDYVAYGALAAGTGMIIAPCTAMAVAASPFIVPKAMILAGSVTGGAMYYASTTKSKNITTWGPSLYGALCGFVGMEVISLGSLLIFGPNVFVQTWHDFDIYAGIPLFAGLAAYDTHLAIENYKNNNADHLQVATKLHLDTTNLLIRFMEILSKLQKK
jgi:FtsH-binding integral membrane protein